MKTFFTVTLICLSSISVYGNMSDNSHVRENLEAANKFEPLFQSTSPNKSQVSQSHVQTSNVVVHQNPQQLKSTLLKIPQEQLHSLIIESKTKKYKQTFTNIHQTIDKLLESDSSPKVQQYMKKLHEKTTLLENEFLNNQNTTKILKNILNLINKIDQNTNNKFTSQLNSLKASLNKFNIDPANTAYLNQNELQNTQNFWFIPNWWNDVSQDTSNWWNDLSQETNPMITDGEDPLL